MCPLQRTTLFGRTIERPAPKQAFHPRSTAKAAASATKVWTLLLEGPTKKGKPEGPSSLKVVRSPPLSPSRGDPPAGEEYAALHDARHVGPLDFASSITSADPVVVYVRLSNFVARRRGRLRLHLEEATASDDDLDLEPFSPVLHPHGVLHHPHGSFDAQFVPDSRLRRSRSGSDSNSSAYGSSPNLQVARQISGDSTSFEERKAETPEEPERLTVHPSPNLERCSTWSETRRTTSDEAPTFVSPGRCSCVQRGRPQGSRR
eukprot:g268.t1